MSISSINLPFPINLKSKSSFLLRGIDPSILIGIFESFNSREKSISKFELLYSIFPLSNNIWLFFIDVSF